MARARYVYVVLEQGQEVEDVLAAFTVKYELISWLLKISTSVVVNYVVVVVKDGDDVRERIPARQYMMEYLYP